MTAVGNAEAPIAGPLAAQVAIFWGRLGRDKQHLSKGAHGGAEADMWCGLDGAGEDVTMAPMEYRALNRALREPIRALREPIRAPGDPGAGRFRLRMHEVCGDCVVRFREWDRKSIR